jgi:hypothetical protein
VCTAGKEGGEGESQLPEMTHVRIPQVVQQVQALVALTDKSRELLLARLEQMRPPVPVQKKMVEVTESSTPNTKPQTPNPKPQTPNPKP